MHLIWARCYLSVLSHPPVTLDGRHQYPNSSAEGIESRGGLDHLLNSVSKNELEQASGPTSPTPKLLCSLSHAGD